VGGVAGFGGTESKKIHDDGHERGIEKQPKNTTAAFLGLANAVLGRII